MIGTKQQNRKSGLQAIANAVFQALNYSLTYLILITLKKLPRKKKQAPCIFCFCSITIAKDV